MEFLREAMEYISQLTRKGEEIQVEEICGKIYATGNLTRYDDKIDRASVLNVSTLSAVVDYAAGRLSEWEGRQDGMLLHIESPTKIVFCSGLDGVRRREYLLQADAVVNGFSFGKTYDQESFMIGLQSNFENTPDLAAIMKLAGNIVKSDSRTYSDDGVTQVASMRTGVSASQQAIVPNPVLLKPYRTFQEVEQPESPFVFRIVNSDEEPRFVLIEAGGGIWKLKAIERVREYLRRHLEERLGKDMAGMITIIG